MKQLLLSAVKFNARMGIDIIDTAACPRSSDPFYIHSKLLYEMGHYFLDI